MIIDISEAEEINRIKYTVCCPMCDNEKCVKQTDECEAEIWAEKTSQKVKEQNDNRKADTRL